MSWTPYVGDPAVQVGETDASFVSASTSKIPGNALGSRRPGMSPGQRLQTVIDAALGSSTLSPDQQWFRGSILRGRWGLALPVAASEQADRPVNMVRRHPDGTCDVIALEACGKFHLDLGGAGARDVAAGRPL